VCPASLQASLIPATADLKARVLELRVCANSRTLLLFEEK